MLKRIEEDVRYHAELYDDPTSKLILARIEEMGLPNTLRALGSTLLDHCAELLRLAMTTLTACAPRPRRPHAVPRVGLASWSARSAERQPAFRAHQITWHTLWLLRRSPHGARSHATAACDNRMARPTRPSARGR